MASEIERVFLESGVWDKPEGARWVRVEMTGGSAGPASDGAPGPPGELLVRDYVATDLPDHCPVEIGKGGRVGTNGAIDPASGQGWARVTTYFDGEPPKLAE